MGFDYESFNADDFEPSKSFDALPAGDYEVTITDATEAPNSKGTGILLKLSMDIVSGEFEGRKLWDRLNIKHENPTAQEIGLRALADICRACGRPNPGPNCSAILNKPIVAKVKVGSYNGEPTNEVKAYKPIDKKKAAAQPEAVKTNRQAVVANSAGDDIPF